jgi:inner membrane protein COX18
VDACQSYFAIFYHLNPDWCFTIITGSLVLRSLVTFPLKLQSHNRQVRLSLLQPLLTKNNQKELTKKYNCSPGKTILYSLSQIPLFILVSITLRKMVAVKFLWLDTPDIPLDGMLTGGMLWFENLAVSDPTLITPLILGALHFANFRFLVFQNKRHNSIWLSVSSLLALASIPIATHVPMALSLYWLTSATFSLAQNFCFYHFAGALKNRVRLM